MSFFDSKLYAMSFSMNLSRLEGSTFVVGEFEQFVRRQMHPLP